MLDFLVIGGGIAGVSAAARLSELGSVLLLEAEASLAHHASSRSASVFEESYGAPSTVALNRASRGELETRGVLSPRGLLLVAREEDEAAFTRDLAELGMEEVGLPEARARFPLLGEAVARAGWTPDLLDLDTDRLLQGFAREARANGARLEVRRPVTAIRRTGAGWVVEAGEVLGARVLVDAAGPWADRVAAMAGLPPLNCGLCAGRWRAFHRPSIPPAGPWSRARGRAGT
jgi:glycine/D-amino acid oxidase-like deaminating enzyme